MNSKATAAALTLAIPLAAVAQTSVEEHQSQIEKALENALSKQGLSIGGVATGEYLSSELSGSSKNDALRSTEPVTYTQVDFDFRARPNTTTTARAVMRMHIDWPSFWGSPYTPIETRWLSLDGKAMQGMLYYGLGDIGVRWTPYTMWAPDVGFLYTPRIFQQGQDQAMADRFQGGNKRNLQGLQFGMRAGVPDVNIDSFDVGVLGAKLASADHSNAEQLKAAYPFNWGAFDRYAVAAHGDIGFYKAANLGVTYLMQTDLKSTFDSTVYKSTTKAAGARDSAQNGSVVAARAAFQVDKVINMNGWRAGIGLEFAHSSWDSYTRRDSVIYTRDVDGDGTTYTAKFDDTTAVTELDTIGSLSGNGINVSVNGGYSLPQTVDANLVIGYLQNDSAFRNDVAQSPTFHGGRIMNTEQLANASGWGVYYSTFDAMYHNVYRFVPEAGSNNTAKNAVEKNNYTNQVFDPTQYSLRQLDWNLQMVLPGGEATANRVGPKVDVDVAVLDGAVDLKGAFYSLQEVKASQAAVNGASSDTISLDPTNPLKAKYQKIQVGAKLRAEKFMKGVWDLPLEFAVSYEQNTGKADGSALNYSSDVINVGLYAAVHKRVALLAGYQSIDGKNKTGIDDHYLVAAGYPINNKQTNLGLGVEFKIQEGAYVMAMWNQLTTKFSGLTDKDFDQNMANVKLQMAF